MWKVLKRVTLGLTHFYCMRLRTACRGDIQIPEHHKYFDTFLYPAPAIPLFLFPSSLIFSWKFLSFWNGMTGLWQGQEMEFNLRIHGLQWHLWRDHENSIHKLSKIRYWTVYNKQNKQTNKQIQIANNQIIHRWEKFMTSIFSFSISIAHS